MIQYSGVRGGNKDEDKVDSRRGILLMRKDRRISVVGAFSLRKFAFANMSKDARIRSIIVCRISP